MRGRVALVGSVLVLAGVGPAQPAHAQADRVLALDPGQTLMEVKVPSERLYQQLLTQYDFVEANQRNGDGSVSTDVLVNPGEKAALRAQGVQFIQTLEDASDTQAVTEERDAAQLQEAT